MRAWRGSFLVLAICMLLAGQVGAARLRDAALTAPASDSARLVLDLTDAPGKPNIFTMTGPHRLVIDLPKTSAAQGLKLPRAAGPVRALRQGAQANGALRVVLELTQPVKWESRLEGRKLIVDLGRVGAASSMAAAEAPAAPPKPVRAAHAPTDAGRDIIVAIDPGHGGKDPGALGPGGTREKDVVLAISKALAKRINAEPGMKAYLTREDDRFIVLRDRYQLARKAGADLFISVHADANPKSNITGSSVYVLSSKGASSEAARLLAERENAADLKGGIKLSEQPDDLASVLMEVSQTATIGASGAAAELVLSQLDRVGTIRKTQVQNAGFMVLKAHDIPSMLIETAFISNPGEEKKLRTPSHQQAIADAIFKGVKAYFLEHPPDGTLFARQRGQKQGGAPLVAAREAP
jgi:N-acetylmuramoyl-L-alanine amidase